MKQNFVKFLVITLATCSMGSARSEEKKAELSGEVAPAATNSYQERKYWVEIQPNIFSMIFGEYGGSTQVAMHPNFSFGLMGTYMPGTELKFGSSEFSVSGFSIGPKATYYSAGIAKDSWTITGILPYANASVTSKTKDISGTSSSSLTLDVSSLSVLGLVGRRWVWDSGFIVSAGIGLKSILYGNVKASAKSGKSVDDAKASFATGKVGPAADLSFGILL